jgi:acetyl esterase/lipase
MTARLFMTAIILAVGFSVLAQDNQNKAIKTEYKLEENILYRDSAKEQLDDYASKLCRLDIYYPVNSVDFTTVIWIHGGGLMGGSKEIPDILKNRGFAVVGIGYRKFPEVKCPVYLEDAAAAVVWTFNNIMKYGGDPSKIILSGHSAGGYLDLMLAMDKRWLGKFGIKAEKIAGVIPLSPQVITHFRVRQERGIGETQVVVDEFAPIHHISKELPPIVIITGDRELEMFGRYEENAYFVRMMKLAGNERIKLFELDGLGHSEMMKPGLYLMLKELKKMLEE